MGYDGGRRSLVEPKLSVFWRIWRVNVNKPGLNLRIRAGLEGFLGVKEA